MHAHQLKNRHQKRLQGSENIDLKRKIAELEKRIDELLVELDKAKEAKKQDKREEIIVLVDEDLPGEPQTETTE